MAFEVNSVVGDDHSWLAAPFDQRRQLASNTTTGDRGIRDCCQAFTRHVVDNIEHTKPPSAGHHVLGTGNVTTVSGGDTTLAGAVVSGNSVSTIAGGNLNIVSRQDTATYDEKTLGASLGFSNLTGVSGGVQVGKTKGTYANVAEQSGIVAGDGGYHVTAGGNVGLIGGVIASTADPAKNDLTASSLTFSNLENTSEASTSSYGFSLTPGGLPVPSIGQPAKQSDTGAALATLTPGKLTLSHQTQDLASLNTDLSKANDTVKPFDIDKLKAQQQSAAALSQLANIAIGDIATHFNLPEGGVEKTALHAAAGALTALVAGGNVGTGALAISYGAGAREDIRR